MGSAPVAWSVDTSHADDVVRIDDKVVPALQARSHKGGNNVALYESHPNDSRVTGPKDVCPTISSRFGTGGNNTPLVSCYDHKDLGRRSAEFIEQAPTLKSRMGTGGCNVPLVGRMVAFGEYADDGTFSTVKARDYKDATDLISECMTVRRLTPLECERLQDYGDGWTDIEGASDSAKYKALGNGLAVVCAEFVLEGIAEADMLS